MDIKKFIFPTLVMYIYFQATDFIIHNVMLKAIYEKLAAVWRPDMLDKLWIMYFAGLIYSFLFVYIFSKGYKGRGIVEGFRYGILIGLLMSFVNSLNAYAIFPIPYYLVIHWTVYGMIQAIIGGVLVSIVYRVKKEA